MRYKYNEDNIYIETVLDTDLENTTDVRPKNGLYRAIWNGSEWVEGANKETIEKINKENDKIENNTIEKRLTDIEIILSELIGGENNVE